jgi:hypothetical protein
VPDTPQLTFKAIQTYRDGKNVSWIQTPAPGSTAEPEYPAPTLKLTGAAAASDSVPSGSPAKPVPSASAATGTASNNSSGSGTPVLAVVATVLAAAALLLAAAPARVSSRRRGQSR